mgnify:CR=1 FL=1
MEGSLRISLKAARVNAKLTQKEAAKRLGVCVATLQNYESGNSVPDWNTVRQIERVYGIQAENIFFESNSA